MYSHSECMSMSMSMYKYWSGNLFVFGQSPLSGRDRSYLWMRAMESTAIPTTTHRSRGTDLQISIREEDGISICGHSNSTSRAITMVTGSFDSVGTGTGTGTSTRRVRTGCLSTVQLRREKEKGKRKKRGGEKIE